MVDECLRLKEAEERALALDPTSPQIDIAILMRTNAQFRVVERQLIREGVDHRIVNGVKFFDRREIRDAISYLKVLARPCTNDLALERIINVPPRLIGDKTVLRLQNISHALNISMWQVLEKLEQLEQLKTLEQHAAAAAQSDAAPSMTDKERSCLAVFPTRSKTQLLVFKEMMDNMRATIPLFHEGPQQEKTPIATALLAIIKDSGYGDWIRYDNPAGEDRWNNLRELVNFASGTPDVEEWLDEVALLSDPQELSSKPDATLATGSSSSSSSSKPIKMMTIHAAKGSEFDVVFVAGMEEELLPHHYALAEDNVDEERRLCYVAVTRAKRRVFLTYAKERNMWGQRRIVAPSQFLNEIDGPLVQWMGQEDDGKGEATYH